MHTVSTDDRFDTGANSFAMLVEPEILEIAETHRRIHALFLDDAPDNKRGREWWYSQRDALRRAPAQNRTPR